MLIKVEIDGDQIAELVPWEKREEGIQDQIAAAYDILVDAHVIDSYRLVLEDPEGKRRPRIRGGERS